MNQPIYCEQAQYSGFFEPWNTVTNLAFIIAGIILILQLKKRNQLDAKAIYLSTVLIAIGLGSFAWHLYRTNITFIADSTPIGVFVLSYIFFYLKYTSKKTSHLILLLAGFLIFTAGLTMYLNSKSINVLNNGGASFFSAITYFGILQVYNIFFCKTVIKNSLIIILVFLMSLTFRQTDLSLCTHISFGTHFMWHILNGVSLYLMIRVLYPKKVL